MPQVTECHRVTGEDCFVMKIHIAAIEELDHVLDQFLSLRADHHVAGAIDAGAAAAAAAAG